MKSYQQTLVLELGNLKWPSLDRILFTVIRLLKKRLFFVFPQAPSGSLDYTEPKHIKIGPIDETIFFPISTSAEVSLIFYSLKFNEAICIMTTVRVICIQRKRNHA